MGQPKGLLRINGIAILDDLFDRLNWPGPTLLITAPGREKPTLNLRMARELVDPICGQGPLRGLLTAFEHLQTRLLIVVTVDMPGICRRQIDWLIDALEARPDLLGVMTSRLAGGAPVVEPFPSAYRIEARISIESRLATQRRSMHGLLDDPRFGLLPAPAQWSEEEVWTNLNTPTDVKRYEEVRRRAASHGEQI